MRDAMMRLLPMLVCVTVGGCTQSPDVVAIALGVAGDDGGLGDAAQSGGFEQPASTDAGMFTTTDSGECDYEQALMNALIPLETVFVALSCEVPLGAVQSVEGEAAPQQLVAQLLNTSRRLETQSVSAQQCVQQPGGWWVEEQTVHLCPELCRFVNDVVADLVQASCDAPAGSAAVR